MSSPMHCPGYPDSRRLEARTFDFHNIALLQVEL